MDTASEMLLGLSEGELIALGDGLLVPSAQGRLDELLRRNAEGGISPQETRELDSLLARIDQLNILKTRARFTLRQQAAGARGT
jgi:hypothetical protein